MACVIKYVFVEGAEVNVEPAPQGRQPARIGVRCALTGGAMHRRRLVAGEVRPISGRELKRGLSK